MKQNQIILIIIGFILVALMATNPSTYEHKEAVKEKVSAVIENNNSNGNAFQKIGQTIGIALIDKMIKRENYLIFSITKVKLLDIYKNEKVVGYGILGKVYLTNDFSEKVTKKIEESSNPIIGNTIKIENLEVTEKTFPNTMDFESAKKACEELGNGWRLPTKEELKFLYKNKRKIGGFLDDFYWSSTEAGYMNDGEAIVWTQRFDFDAQVYLRKSGLFYVRAIRAF